MFRNPTVDALVLLLIVLLILGPKRLPSLGKSLGEGMRGFKDSITGDSKDDDDDDEIQALNQAPEPKVAASETPAPAPAAAQDAGRAQADAGSERAS
jgi:sec-independent protein translocase protein TatA